MSLRSKIASDWRLAILPTAQNLPNDDVFFLSGVSCRVRFWTPSCPKDPPVLKILRRVNFGTGSQVGTELAKRYGEGSEMLPFSRQEKNAEKQVQTVKPTEEAEYYRFGGVAFLVRKGPSSDGEPKCRCFRLGLAFHVGRRADHVVFLVLVYVVFTSEIVGTLKFMIWKATGQHKFWRIPGCGSG